MAVKIGSSFSCVFTSLSSPFESRSFPEVSTRSRAFGLQRRDAVHRINHKAVRLADFLHNNLVVRRSSLRRGCSCFADVDGEISYSEVEEDDFEQELLPPVVVEDVVSVNSSDVHIEGGGKPGLVSFYNRPYRREEGILTSTAGKKHNVLLWFVGPAVLVAAFIFPSLYLRRIFSAIFEDSLLTDFLILFFTEALFYSGVAVFLLLVDHLRRPVGLISSSSNRNITPPLGYRISSIAVLALSLIIPMVTMGFVWPWTGPAASATLAPYLVGIVVQFAFEQYARYIDSPAWSVIPIIFQVYRLHQLNRAAQLVTALSLTVRGAEMSAHNLAINSSLSTLLNVLQFLGVICIWSLSNFIMRFFPSATIADG